MWVLEIIHKNSRDIEKAVYFYGYLSGNEHWNIEYSYKSEYPETNYKMVWKLKE